MKFNQQLCYDDPSVYNMSNEFLASQFPFTFQSAFNGNISAFSSAEAELFHKERRLSITGSLLPLRPLEPLYLQFVRCSGGNTQVILPNLKLNKSLSAEMNHTPSLRTPPQRLRTAFDNQLADPKDAQIQGHSVNALPGMTWT